MNHFDTDFAIVPQSLELKRNRVDRLPLLLRNEMNISLRRPPVQMAHKSSNLVPRFALGHQDRDERMPQRMKSIQAPELGALDQFLEEPVRPITPTLLYPRPSSSARYCSHVTSTPTERAARQ